MIHVTIALGGLAGALARHGLGFWIPGLAATGFPWSTLAVNLSGSYALGLLMRVLPATTASPAVRAGLTIGACGGFTTFSAFSAEVLGLLDEGAFRSAVAYMAGSLGLGPPAVLTGLWTGTVVVQRQRLWLGPERRSTSIQP